MALTDNGRVYSWGHNRSGQLGDASTINCYEPKLVKSLSEQFVIDICCGLRHSLVLTRNGYVFAFGDNWYGQCGNGRRDDQLIPFQLNLCEVKVISCGYDHSIALTQSGDVFGWGWNISGQLGIVGIDQQMIPTKLYVDKIQQIMCGFDYTLMLSIDGEIYFCGEIRGCLSHKIPTKINTFKKFIKIGATMNCRLCVAMTTENECFIIGDCGEECLFELTRTEFTSIDETFAFYQQISYTTIITNASYRNNFIEMILLGIGGFASVFKCTNNFDKKLYAIKKISFEPQMRESVSKELNILSELKTNFVVKYIDSWIESNYYLNTNSSENIQNSKLNNLLYSPTRTQLLHIQMELCSLKLSDAINLITKESIIPFDNTLSLIGYYICSELLYEILECVQYLHSQNPAIIHRDLKPENMLLTNFVNNRFVRLGDFGLSTFHEFSDQSHTKYIGTRGYRAIELNYSTKYTTKADIYSLGIIIQELFHIDFNDANKCYFSVLKPKMNYLESLVEKLLSPKPDKRLNCDEVLSENYFWRLSEKQILNDNQFRQIISN